MKIARNFHIFFLGLIDIFEYSKRFSRESPFSNAPYHKKQDYIWFMGGDLNGFRDITHFMKWTGWGMSPGEPLGSQAPCH